MGSARFTAGGIGKVHRWWVRQGGGSVFGSYVVCDMGFQQIWRPTFSSPPHFLISPSLSWDWIWKGSEADLSLFYLFLIFEKFEKLIWCMCWEGIFWVCEMTICCVCWEGIFWVCEMTICCVFWEGIFWVCERTICCVCWEGIFWVSEREFFGFMNENLLGLWKGDFLDYQLEEKNV